MITISKFVKDRTEVINTVYYRAEITVTAATGLYSVYAISTDGCEMIPIAKEVPLNKLVELHPIIDKLESEIVYCYEIEVV